MWLDSHWHFLESNQTTIEVLADWSWWYITVYIAVLSWFIVDYIYCLREIISDESK